MSSEKDKAALAGCVLAALGLCVQLPLFGAVIYAALSSAGAPTWAWVLFWIYLPVSFVLGGFRLVVEAIIKAD